MCMGVMNMIIENDYPKIKKKLSKFLLFRKIILIIFAIVFCVSLIVNLICGGRLWFLYVLFGELIFYFAFLNKPLIDNILIKRASILLGITIAYLYTIDRINNTHWSYIVIDILAFSLLLFQLFLFFTNYEYHKNKIIIMLFTSFFSCIFCIMAIIRIVPLNWAVIVTGSVGLFNLLILFTIFFKTTIVEIKKYFNII